jgi:mannose-6-phosphate isomerase-like protein (cupin superfamily)
MPATIIGTANAEHYKWGGANGTDCDAWYLVKTAELNIIEELMPPGTAETPHHHVRARQFAFVLEGQLTMMVEYHDFVLHPGEGLEVSPGQIHQAINRSAAPVRFVMTSQPPSHDDRVEDAVPGAGAAGGGTADSGTAGSGTASSGTATDESVVPLVLKIYRQKMAGKVDSTLLSAEMNAALTPDTLAQAQMLFQQLGEPAKLTMKMHMPSANGTSYVFAGSFKTGDFQVLVEINRAGQVSGYRLAP